MLGHSHGSSAQRRSLRGLRHNHLFNCSYLSSTLFCKRGNGLLGSNASWDFNDRFSLCFHVWFKSLQRSTYCSLPGERVTTIFSWCGWQSSPRLLHAVNSFQWHPTCSGVPSPAMTLPAPLPPPSELQAPPQLSSSAKPEKAVYPHVSGAPVSCSPLRISYLWDTPST